MSGGAYSMFLLLTHELIFSHNWRVIALRSLDTQVFIIHIMQARAEFDHV